VRRVRIQRVRSFVRAGKKPTDAKRQERDEEWAKKQSIHANLHDRIEAEARASALLESKVGPVPEVGSSGPPNGSEAGPAPAMISE
jgi:hypothetical protein